MEGLLSVRIVLAKCEKRSGAFGLRFQEGDPGHWRADWAFPLAEATAKREGYDATIEGRFGFAPSYPGCPWCEARAIVLCGCQRVACWDGKARETTCPWCGDASAIEGTIGALRTGGDR